MQVDLDEVAAVMHRPTIFLLIVVACALVFGANLATSEIPFRQSAEEADALPLDAAQDSRAADARRIKQIALQPRPGQPGGGVLVLADRRMIQRLKKAAQFIEQKKFADAVTLLQIVLDKSEDSFFHPDREKKSHYRSLKAEAHRVIGAMPAEGLRVYELQHGVTARAMLDESLKSDKLAGAAEVSRRFFFTKAGREATYRVGSAHFDRGRPLAAALCFKQLLGDPESAQQWEPDLSLKTALCWKRAGLPNNSNDVLSDLRQRYKGDSIQIGGNEFALFADAEKPTDWLTRIFGSGQENLHLAETDWLMPHGNAARNGLMASDDDRKLTPWKSSVETVYDVTRFPTDAAETENDRDLQKAVTASKTTISQQKRASIPGSQPLLVNGTMYVRTIGNIQALNPTDGSKRWETYYDESFANIIGKSDNAVPGPSQARTLQLLVSQRLWGDLTYGSLSSDGRFIYAVEELGLSTPIYRPQQQPLQPSPTNTLVAYSISGERRIGQRVWTLGGPKGDELLENPLAGTFFLGPPLPLGGQLYCLADVSGEVRLLVIDPARPEELVWSQPLAGAGRPIHQDSGRRIAGSAVSYADGVMVCPTDAGYVIAVDLTQRSLLWGYQYQQVNNGPRPPFPRPPRPPQRTWWLDSTATIADGNVLLTPRGGNDVVCLNLLDGTEKWKKTKQDGLYLAGVIDGKVLLVGTSTVQALSLNDGSAAWKKAAALPTPSGRGFIRDDKLYLPLSTAQIAIVDIATGKIISTPETPRGIVPGNMIAAGNAIISQGVDRVDLFPFPKGEKQVANK